MLKLEKLTKSFGKQVVVNDVSLNVGSEIHVVVGLNGSGKSTMLKMLTGILSPDSGSIKIDEREITELSPEERCIGYVPQHPALFNHMTVLQNIRYCLKNGRGTEQSIDTFIELLELKDFLHKKTKTLSGGFQSRVSLARTLASQPRAMLLDEPLSNLDVAIKEKLIPRFREGLLALSAPVLYVTHDQMEASLLGNKFSVMIKGKLFQVASPEEAFEIIRSSVI